MRVLLTLTAILTIFVALGLWTNHLLFSTADNLAREIEEIMYLAQENAWDKAYQKSEQLAKNWDEKAKWWAIFLDHQEIDNIEFALVKTKKYLQAKEITFTMGQLAELKIMIEHIPEKEAVTITNIL